MLLWSLHLFEGRERKVACQFDVVRLMPTVGMDLFRFRHFLPLFLLRKVVFGGRRLGFTEDGGIDLNSST